VASSGEVSVLSMAGIGERLKEAREKKGLSIEDAQKQTHIHSSVLRALEEGRCDDMLTPTYVKSFLKKYSQYLGLEERDVQRAYASNHPELQGSRVNIPASQDSAIETEGLIRFLKNAAIFVIILVTFIFVWNKTAHYLKDIRQKHGVTETKSLKVSKKNSVTPARKNQAQKTVIPKNTPLKLTLIVKQPVLLSLKADSKLIFKRVISKGTVESFTANESFNIYVAKAEAIELRLNGQFIGSPGKGVIDNIEITRKGIKVK
jgi:cytoskeletal protein RodZ